MENRPRTSTVIPLLQPPRCTPSPANAVHVGENVVITLRDRKKLRGALRTFHRDNGLIEITEEGNGSQQIIPLDRIKLMHAPKLRQWVGGNAPGMAMDQGIQQPDEKQDFEVKFKDGDTLEGQTIGFRNDRDGLCLYPARNADQYIYTFVPHGAIERYRIGPHIGEMLVKENLISEERIGEVLSEQEEKRKQPLGEYMRSQAMVTAMELKQALGSQRSTPNLMLGEILISEQLITEGQLKEALEAQKENRKTPLGEILVSQGLIAAADVQQCLSKKLGIPFVDLRRFQIDQTALKLVPEDLARKHKFVPLFTYEKKLVVAMENPMAWEPLDAIRFHTNLNVEPVIAPLEDIKYIIELVYSIDGLDKTPLEDLTGASQQENDQAEYGDVSGQAIVKLANKIIIDAYQQGASDIHIEPNAGNDKMAVRFRKDGVLTPYNNMPANLRNALVARIKIMAGLDISERRMPQDGKIDFSKFSPLKIELRVATIPTVGGQEDVVMRLLASGKPIPIKNLGLSGNNLERLLGIVDKPHGLFFVCGPTGSGKTTTLHSILGHLNTPDRKIWTAEEPVEITQKGLRQVQVRPKIGLDFAATMRAFLRADPDIIMVGEMRDQETAKTAIEASLTGHLVLATLHTNSAPESLPRLLDMGMDPFNFADALLGVLAQRLTRRLCPACKQSHEASSEEMEKLVEEYCHEFISGGLMETAEESTRKTILSEWQKCFADPQGIFHLFRAAGCKECDNSGYRGRVGIHELLSATASIKQYILRQAPISEILTTGLNEGMRTLKQDGIIKVLLGHTDIQQVRKVCIK